MRLSFASAILVSALLKWAIDHFLWDWLVQYLEINWHLMHAPMIASAASYVPFLIAVLFIVYVSKLQRADGNSGEPAAPKAAGSHTIQTGISGDYDLREPSQCGGILHTISVKITNATGTMLTGAMLSVVNLNPATDGHHDLPLERGIILPAGESTYINVASHTEGVAVQNVMCLQISYPGGFLMPAGLGLLTGEHRFQLQLARNGNRLAESYCRLYVDGHNIMRLEPLDTWAK